MIQVQFKLHEGAEIPFQKRESDAAWDLAAAEARWVWPGEPTKISTGVAMAIPDGFYGDIRPRSSTTMAGIDVDGTVDASYRGIIHILALNNTGEAIFVERGTRIAQIVILPRPLIQWVQVLELPFGERGIAGFGSSGSNV